jgi:hypothetical protein
VIGTFFQHLVYAIVGSLGGVALALLLRGAGLRLSRWFHHRGMMPGRALWILPWRTVAGIVVVAALATETSFLFFGVSTLCVYCGVSLSGAALGLVAFAGEERATTGAGFGVRLLSLARAVYVASAFTAIVPSWYLSTGGAGDLVRLGINQVNLRFAWSGVLLAGVVSLIGEVLLTVAIRIMAARQPRASP